MSKRSSDRQPQRSWFGRDINNLRRCVVLFAISVGLMLAIGACVPNTSLSNSKKDLELILVSFAVTKPANAIIIPKFVQKWQNEQNQTVRIYESYGGSGSQTRAVIDGLDADIVHLALSGDIKKIEKAGLIHQGWEKEYPNEAIVTKSVAALVTRAGNPKSIRDWSDLDGVGLITADPKTSGVARWNFIALWNSVIKTGGDEAKALAFVTKIYQNAPVLTKDAREATDVFGKQGQGDALINYENEIILGIQKGEKLSYVVPDVNISIDNPIALVDKNVANHGTQEVADAFVKYLYSPEAQIEYAKLGFRPVDPAIANSNEYRQVFPEVKNLATIKDFGGWEEAQTKFFADGAIFDQIRNK
jgi:sulfate/thiosulfate transport system substrate-binding protein